MPRGRPPGRTLTERDARTGNDLVLSLDTEVQVAGEAAIGRFGLPGAFVAMNVHNGEILGMGSAPTYDPSVFAKPRIPTATATAIFGDPDDPQPARRPGDQPRHRQAPIPPARPSSRSPRSRRSTRACSSPATSSPTAARSPTAESSSSTPARSPTESSTWSAPCRSPPTSSSTSSAPTPTSRRATADRSRTGRAASASAPRPASTSPARSRAACRHPSSETSLRAEHRSGFTLRRGRST